MRAGAGSRPHAVDAVRRLLHSLRRHRRLLAAGCVAVAVAAALESVAAKPPAGTQIVAAARDLQAGSTLTATDLRTITLPTAALPAGAITSTPVAVGRTISGALRQGEPLTDVRLDGGPLGRPAPGMVAAPVRLADAQAAALLQPGDHIDVLAASTSTQTETAPTEATVVAADVRVVAIPGAAADPTAPAAAVDIGVSGALVVLATTPAQARALAQAQVSARLSAVVVR